MRPLTSLFSLLLLTALGSGCAPFKLTQPPPGFAEVSAYSGHARFKSGDDVGISINTFHNVKGGTLAFWAEDLIEKLGRRGYQLKKQSPVASRNGVVGTRFDFEYVPPTSENEHKFYTAVLFVSDQNRVVVQVAGEAPLAGKYDAQTNQLAREIVIRGCKGSDICKGPQPTTLSTPSMPVIATGNDEPEPASQPDPPAEPDPQQ